MSRKLATVRIISEIAPIEGADSIEVALIDSWKVVVRKGEVFVGSEVVYFEIDSWIPHTLAPFLSKNAPKKYNEVEGERLKTIKLRGQISQGLIMNFSDIKKVFPDFSAVEGDDVTELLGIMKWELPSSITNFQTRGNFPNFIPKTDQDRIQNLTKKFNVIKQFEWEITEKYDGSSMTVYVNNNWQSPNNNWQSPNNNLEGVCSRNLDLKLESEGPINSFWEIAIREKLIEKIKSSGRNIALQGELVGVKIGPNIYKLTGRDFYLFDIYDIDNGVYFTPLDRQAFAAEYNIKQVPIIANGFKIFEETTIDDLLKLAEGKSVLNDKTEREGLVFKNMERNLGINSFKVISNNYLLKTGN